MQIDAQAAAIGQNSKTQFILAEVQDDVTGGYQRFYINKSDSNGDTAYALSRLIYFMFQDQRVLGDSNNPAEINNARLSYFQDLGTVPHPLRINQLEGYATVAPATTAELQTSPEYQALRAADPNGLQQLLALATNANRMPDAQAFQYRNGLIMAYLRQHWNVQAVVLPDGGYT